jgi:hypothetical protein
MGIIRDGRNWDLVQGGTKSSLGLGRANFHIVHIENK